MLPWQAEFTKLKAWQVACDVAEEVYTLTDTFPRREIFGLTAQMRSAAVSMSTNIAEGYGRRHPRDKARFYEISRSSGEELKSLLCLSFRFGYVELAQFDPAMTRLDHACRLAHGLVEAASSWAP